MENNNEELFEIITNYMKITNINESHPLWCRLVSICIKYHNTFDKNTFDKEILKLKERK